MHFRCVFSHFHTACTRIIIFKITEDHHDDCKIIVSKCIFPKCIFVHVPPSKRKTTRVPGDLAKIHPRTGIEEHFTFVNSNYNILPTLSLKLLIQYQLSQRERKRERQRKREREAFFRPDAYLKILSSIFYLNCYLKFLSYFLS